VYAQSEEEKKGLQKGTAARKKSVDRFRSGETGYAERGEKREQGTASAALLWAKNERRL